MQINSLMAVVFFIIVNVTAFAMQGTNSDGSSDNFVFESRSGLVADFYGRPILIKEVDMDKYRVVRGDYPAIGTEHVATCVAVGGVGSVGKEKVLALGHASVLVPAECALLKITHELRKAGCPYSSIKIFLLGGNPLSTEEGFLDPNLIKTFNIRGYLFNPLNLESRSSESESDDDYYSRGVNVIFTPNGFNYGEDLHFLKADSLDGEDDWNDNEPLPPSFSSDGH